MRSMNAAEDYDEVMAFEREAPESGVRDKSLLSNLMQEVRQIASLACRKVPDHVREDVESAAMLGLMEALRHLDEMTPDQFRRYLGARVQGALRAEAQHFDPLSRTERLMVQRVERITTEYRKAYGQNPEISRVAREIGCDEDACWNALELSEFTILPLSEEPSEEEVLSPEEAFVGSYSAAALRWGLAQLSRRERLVLRLVYKRGLSLAAIARRLGVSAPRAYQIRVFAERKLEKLLRNSPAMSKMNTITAKFDWDDFTEETLKESPRRRNMRVVGRD